MREGTGRRWSVRFAVLLALVGVLIMGAAPVSAAASSSTVSVSFPIDLVVFVPCAAGGAGELIELNGSLHDLFHITFDGAGGLHVKLHDNPLGLSGVGLTTGAKYQGTGVTQEEFNFTVGVQDTFVNNFRMIGQGPGNNLLIHENYHVTVNANGTLTAFVDNFTADCK